MEQSDEPAAGIAALAVCEAILLAMVDANLLDIEEVKEILEDATVGQRVAANGECEIAAPEKVARLIDEMGKSFLAVQGQNTKG